MEKTRNLGIDILCCLAGIMLLGVCLFDQIGLEQITITGYSGALPIAVRWFCMSGAMLLAACAGYVLSVRKYAASHFKTVGRLLYIYLVGTAVVFAARRFLIGEEMTPMQMFQELLGFSASSTSHITGMYFLLMLAAPFLNTAFQGLKSRSARMTFVVIPAIFGTLQPILHFGEITVIPQWCIGLAPIAAYLGGAFIRRYGKARDIVILTIFALLAFAAQVITALMTSLRTGFIDCPWLESMAALPSLLMALCLVGLFHSRHEGSGTAHRFFGGATGGILMGVMIAEPLMRCLMLNIVDSFPIISTRLVAGIVVVPLVFIMCAALSLMLQFPILLRRQASSNAVYEEETPKPRAKKKRPKRTAPVTEAPQAEETYEEEPEYEDEPEIEEEPEADAEPEIEAEAEEEPEDEAEPEIEDEPEIEAEAEEEPEDDAEPDVEEEPEGEAEPEAEDEPEDEAEDTEFEIADEDEPEEDGYEAEEAEASEEYENDDEDYEEDSEEDYEEESEAPAVSISLPHRVSQPLPQASENSSRHSITVPVSQPETQIRLTQPPPEPPIGVREATRPAIAPLRPTFTKPQPVQPQPAYTKPEPAQPQPAYVPPAQPQTPEPEPPEYQTRSYTLDEILTEQGIPVKHMPETVDDLIKELTK